MASPIDEDNNIGLVFLIKHLLTQGDKLRELSLELKFKTPLFQFYLEKNAWPVSPFQIQKRINTFFLTYTVHYPTLLLHF